jgi:isopentenyl-diphosphate Delta-isomerase
LGNSTLEKNLVVLVNESDVETGQMEKMEAHRTGSLHRAFSVFIFDSKGRMLLQQRAAGKYHSPLLWSNTCCSHPYPGEDVQDAAIRRLGEEMGFTTPIRKVFDFVYNAPVENGLTEHEFDHVFIGEYEGAIEPHREEVSSYTYKALPEIKMDLEERPELFTAWFRIVFPKIEEWWEKNYPSRK